MCQAPKSSYPQPGGSTLCLTTCTSFLGLLSALFSSGMQMSLTWTLVTRIRDLKLFHTCIVGQDSSLLPYSSCRHSPKLTDFQSLIAFSWPPKPSQLCNGSQCIAYEVIPLFSSQRQCKSGRWSYKENCLCRYDGWITEMQGQEAHNVTGQPKGIDNLLYSADAGVCSILAFSISQAWNRISGECCPMETNRSRCWPYWSAWTRIGTWKGILLEIGISDCNAVVYERSHISHHPLFASTFLTVSLIVAAFSCFADLAVTSPQDYNLEGQGSLMQCVLTPAERFMPMTNEEIAAEVDAEVWIYEILPRENNFGQYLLYVCIPLWKRVLSDAAWMDWRSTDALFLLWIWKMIICSLSSSHSLFRKDSHAYAWEFCTDFPTRKATLPHHLFLFKLSEPWKAGSSVGEEAFPLSKGVEEHLAFHSQDWPVPLQRSSRDGCLPTRPGYTSRQILPGRLLHQARLHWQHVRLHSTFWPRY